MHVGYSPAFEDLDDKLGDHEVYQEELRLCDLAEPPEFESIWQPEHHFTNYEMAPDVVQFLSYMVVRTGKARLGSMVVVLPWQDPIGVAEKFSSLDSLSGGRAIRVRPLLEQRIADTPLRRLGQTSDISNAVLFPASDDSTFVWAAELIVDGCYLARD